MCGLFGFSGKKQPNIKKLLILGLYNQSRGKDASGYWYNFSSLKDGSYLTGAWEDFIRQSVILPSSKKYHTFVGHVRSASVGSKTTENAHPFIIDNLVIAHNGTLQNHKELLEKYDIWSSSDVDSHALGELINKVGYSILEEYKGYAALLMVDTNYPDELKVYHGKSKTYTMGMPTEERPLWYMQTAEGVYFSSIEDALIAIRDSEEEKPYNILYNTVITFKSGEYLSEKNIIINRESANVNIHVTRSTGYYPNENGYPRANSYPRSNAYTQPSKLVHEVQSSQNFYENKPLENKIWLETKTNFRPLIPRKMYFHKFRYWDSEGDTLLQGRYRIYKGRIMEHYSEESSVIFQNDSLLGEVRYFLNGAELTREGWDTAFDEQMLFANDSSNYALFLSKYTAHPVSNLEDEALGLADMFRFKIYLGGKPCTERTLSLPDTNRHYHIDRSGYLSSISCSDKSEKLLYTKEQLAIAKLETLPVKFQDSTEDVDTWEASEGEITRRIAAYEKIITNTYITLADYFENIPLPLENAIKTAICSDLEEKANATTIISGQMVESAFNYLITSAFKKSISIIEEIQNELDYENFVEALTDEVEMELEEEGVTDNSISEDDDIPTVEVTEVENVKELVEIEEVEYYLNNLIDTVIPSYIAKIKYYSTIDTPDSKNIASNLVDAIDRLKGDMYEKVSTHRLPIYYRNRISNINIPQL
jgi:hypothetical protein